jgi:hypothetical protein
MQLYYIVVVIAILLSVASLPAPYFSTLSHKRHNYWGGGRIIEDKICVLISPTPFFRKYFSS